MRWITQRSARAGDTRWRRKFCWIPFAWPDGEVIYWYWLTWIQVFERYDPGGYYLDPHWCIVEVKADT